MINLTIKIFVSAKNFVFVEKTWQVERSATSLPKTCQVYTTTRLALPNLFYRNSWTHFRFIKFYKQLILKEMLDIAQYENFL